MKSLQLTELTKTYRTQEVLLGVNLDIKAGSFAAILGPSGSGKTTLLRLIAGFERADHGCIRLGDTVVDDSADIFLSPDHRKVGYVPQEGALFPHLSVQQNVGFGLPRHQRRGQRVSELLEMVGLAGMERRYPHQLSGGQQQRVALARALAIDPEIVLLDEPFSALDANLRSSVRRDVRNVLRDSGTTAVLVTHDQDEALSLADVVAIIDDGKIGQLGTPRDLYIEPISPEIAAGLGESNLVPGTALGNTVETPFGPLVLTNGPIESGTALRVLLRPEQLALDDNRAGTSPLGKVVDAEYYGHDAVVRVKPSWDPASTLVVRVASAVALPEIGTEVAVRASGAVIGWRDHVNITTNS